MIEGGRLIRSDSLSTFTGRTEVLSIEVDGPVDGPRRATCGSVATTAQEAAHTLELDLGDDGAYDAIRDGAASLGLGLIRVEQGRRHLEDLFRDETEDEASHV